MRGSGSARYALFPTDVRRSADTVAHPATVSPRSGVRQLRHQLAVYKRSVKRARHGVIVASRQSGPGGALVRESESADRFPTPWAQDPIATELGRPSSVIRFRMLQATTDSDPCASG